MTEPYADDTILMAESEEELKSLLMKGFSELTGYGWVTLSRKSGIR